MHHKQYPNTDEIRMRYFGQNAKSVLRDGSSHCEKATPSSELTPAARYVAKEAQKLIGQSSADGPLLPLEEEDLLRLVSLVENTEGEELSETERTKVVASLSASLDHYDILTPLVENPDINDIIVRTYKDISIQVGRENLQTDLSFPDHDSYKAFVENLLKRAGKSCTTATPVVDAAIDPHVRACVTHESFSPMNCGPMLTLRIARHRHISVDALIQYELAPRLILDYLTALVRDARVTVLVAGEVGSGKTTLVKALASQLESHEALLIIEDTHELVLERPFVRTLLTRDANTEGAGRITPAQAIRTGMRMAMNRVILGEMRDAEAAEAFIDVCASGHAGLSTIHARSARDAVSRLELFLSRAQGNVMIDTIRRQIANAVSVIVYLDVDRRKQKRRIYEVFEVEASVDGVVQISPMFSYNPESSLPEWRRDSGLTSFQRELKQAGVKLPGKGKIATLDPEGLYCSHVVEQSA